MTRLVFLFLFCLAEPAATLGRFTSGADLRSKSVARTELALQHGDEPSELPAKKALRIPWQLVLTGAPSSMDKLSAAVQANVHRNLAMNPGVAVRYLGDNECYQYLKANYSGTNFAFHYAMELSGAQRGDLCRTAVLAREGGFYVDLDMQLRVPLTSLVDENTTFMSAHSIDEGSVLNAILAATPGNAIIQETLTEMLAWYQPDASHLDEVTQATWMGPITTARALRKFLTPSCGGPNLRYKNLQRRCGDEVISIFQEEELPCSIPNNPDCPPERATAEYNGLRFGIYTPGQDHQLVAWSRFVGCNTPGCTAGGADKGTPMLKQI